MNVGMGNAGLACGCLGYVALYSSDASRRSGGMDGRVERRGVLLMMLWSGVVAGDGGCCSIGWSCSELMCRLDSDSLISEVRLPAGEMDDFVLFRSKFASSSDSLEDESDSCACVDSAFDDDL